MLGQVLADAARQIIQDPYGMPLLQQRLYQIRAYEPGTTGDEKASHPRSLKQLQKRRKISGISGPPRASEGNTNRSFRFLGSATPLRINQ
jgi:hypothetical protein